MKRIISLSFFLLAFCMLHAQKSSITASQAVNYIGKTVNICDVITEARLDNISKDEPTVLYCGATYENRTLALIFTQAVLQTFSYEPTAKLINHNFCVRGKVVLYQGKPGIYIKSQSQLHIPQ